MRAVIDTNVLVRAMLKPDGSVGPVVDFLRHGRYVFLYSEATLNELIEVLSRPRMVHRYGLTAAEVETLCALVIRRGCAEGRAEGRAEQASRSLLTVLRARGIAVPDAVRERIQAQKDPERLERWLEKAAVASSVAAVIDEPS